MVLAHISGRWPENELMAEYFSNNNEFKFHVYDSILHEESVGNYDEIVESWKSFLNKNNFQYLMGISFGGCILQNVLGDIGAGEKLVCLSSPAFLDNNLKKNIFGIQQLLSEGMYLHALKKLYSLLGPECIEMSTINESLKHLDPERFIRGFRWIQQHDGRASLESGKFLCHSLFGHYSRLVTASHGHETKYSTIGVMKQSGMRILSEDHTDAMKIISKFYCGDSA